MCRLQSQKKGGELNVNKRASHRLGMNLTRNAYSVLFLKIFGEQKSTTILVSVGALLNLDPKL